MGCGEGYLAVSTYGVDASASSSAFPRPRDGKISVYALDVKVGAEGSSSASLAFHSPVVGGDGVTVALAVSGESIWALQEACGRDGYGETLGVAGERALKGWPLESLNRAPCETLGDAAAELGAWAVAPPPTPPPRAPPPRSSPRRRRPGSLRDGVGRVRRLASELAFRGVASSAVLTAALDAVDQPCPAGTAAARAAAATRASPRAGRRSAGRRRP